MSENRKPAPSKNQIEKLKSLVDDAYAAVRKAEEYATETGQSFSFNIAYGDVGRLRRVVQRGRLEFQQLEMLRPAHVDDW